MHTLSMADIREIANHQPVDISFLFRIVYYERERPPVEECGMVVPFPKMERDIVELA